MLKTFNTETEYYACSNHFNIAENNHSLNYYSWIKVMGQKEIELQTVSNGVTYLFQWPIKIAKDQSTV